MKLRVAGNASRAGKEQTKKNPRQSGKGFFLRTTHWRD